jgi:hypothetical protein
MVDRTAVEVGGDRAGRGYARVFVVDAEGEIGVNHAGES